MRSATTMSFLTNTATAAIYTLSLHDALPICEVLPPSVPRNFRARHELRRAAARSEEHTSELQSQSNLVCRLLLEKKRLNLSACEVLLSRKPNSVNLKRPRPTRPA